VPAVLPAFRMKRLFRVIRALRKGPRTRRVQAWAGLACVASATIWAVSTFLWQIALFALLFGAGLALLGLSSRDSQPST